MPAQGCGGCCPAQPQGVLTAPARHGHGHLPHGAAPGLAGPEPRCWSTLVPWSRAGGTQAVLQVVRETEAELCLPPLPAAPSPGSPAGTSPCSLMSPRGPRAAGSPRTPLSNQKMRLTTGFPRRLGHCRVPGALPPVPGLPLSPRPGHATECPGSHPAQPREPRPGWSWPQLRAASPLPGVLPGTSGCCPVTPQSTIPTPPAQEPQTRHRPGPFETASRFLELQGAQSPVHSASQPRRAPGSPWAATQVRAPSWATALPAVLCSEQSPARGPRAQAVPGSPCAAPPQRFPSDTRPRARL